MNFLRIFVILLLALSTNVQSDSFFSKDDFSIGLGLNLTTINYKRGMLLYEGFQAAPIITVGLFNPNLFFAGSSVYYKHDLIKDILNLRSRLHINSTRDTPLFYTQESKNERVRRDSTTELNTYLEYNISTLAYLALQYSQDLFTHGGQYLEAKAQLALYNYYKSDSDIKALIQAAIYTSIGAGSQSHNKYLYGNGASKNSFNNIEYGLTINTPKIADLFFPSLKLSFFEILGSKNRSASYVKEKKGWALEASVAFNIY